MIENETMENIGEFPQHRGIHHCIVTADDVSLARGMSGVELLVITPRFIQYFLGRFEISLAHD